MTSVTTLQSVIERMSESPADHGIRLIDGDRSRLLTHRELWRASHSVAGRLRSLGVRRGRSVVIALPLGSDLLTAIFGTSLAGGAVVCLNPGLLAADLDAHAQFVHRVLALTDSPVCIASQALSAALRSIDPRPSFALWDIAADTPSPSEAGPTEHVSSDDVAVIQFTSGTQGTPKGVVLSHANILANAMGLVRRLDATIDDIGVLWVPLFHDMGLNGLFINQLLQSRLTLLSPELFLYRPELWLQAISETRATLSTAPNFAYARCALLPDDRLAGIDLSSWRAALCGAERVRADSLRRFSERFATRGFDARAFLPVYGLAEATLCATMPEPGRPLACDRMAVSPVLGGGATPDSEGDLEHVGVGHPLDGHELRIVDEGERPVPPRQVGEIQLRGPSVCRGYLGDSEGTARLLADGWLRTGDFGYVSGEHLFVIGRCGEKIVIHGANHCADDIEQVLEELPVLRRGGTIAVAVAGQTTDELLVGCELRAPDAIDDEAAEDIEHAIRGALGTRLRLVPRTVILLPPRSIPKTPTGKKQRSAFRDAYLAGRIAALPLRGASR